MVGKWFGVRVPFRGDVVQVKMRASAGRQHVCVGLPFRAGDGQAARGNAKRRLWVRVLPPVQLDDRLGRLAKGLVVRGRENLDVPVRSPDQNLWKPGMPLNDAQARGVARAGGVFRARARPQDALPCLRGIAAPSHMEILTGPPGNNLLIQGRHVMSINNAMKVNRLPRLSRCVLCPRPWLGSE